MKLTDRISTGVTRIVLPTSLALTLGACTSFKQDLPNLAAAMDSYASHTEAYTNLHDVTEAMINYDRIEDCIPGFPVPQAYFRAVKEKNLESANNIVDQIAINQDNLMLPHIQRYGECLEHDKRGSFAMGMYVIDVLKTAVLLNHFIHSDNGYSSVKDIMGGTNGQRQTLDITNSPLDNAVQGVGTRTSL